MSSGLWLLLGCLLFVSAQAIPQNRFARQAAMDWGDWSPWSTCSRSCGGGVSYQERSCLPSTNSTSLGCVGPYRNYRSCQIQDCPDGAVDFRYEQCAAYNTVPFEGKLFRWVPFLGGPNICELNCMPKGEHFYYRHAEKVIDGTRCGQDTLDVCVDGVCKSVGCDMMLGSDTVEDMCRECGGDNSTCRLFQGQFIRPKLPEGYNDIHIIPAGATNIRIAELRSSNNYLALRSATGQYILNGGFSIDFPNSFSAAGTMIHYKRKIGHPQDRPEVITSLGPLDEPLFIVLLTQGRNLGIEYSYYLPNGVGPDEPDSYSWSYSPYSNCTKECGGGYQTRNVACTRSGDYEPVPSYLCDPALKPPTNRTCNTNSCPPRWFTGEWSPCSQTCDEGAQVRQVYCQQVLENGRTEPIDEAYCLAVLGFKPDYQQHCILETCPHWQAGEWSECSLVCGLGTQTRDIECVSDVPEPDSACSTDERPVDEQDCNLGPCEGVDWLTSEWTSCTGFCSTGHHSRYLHCATRGGTIFEEELCDSSTRPPIAKACLLESECGPQWLTTQWSECSTTCGDGVHSRLVFCGNVSADSFVQIPDDECEASTKFLAEETCNLGSCNDTYIWFTGPWSRCTAPCGGGTRSRTLVCLLGETPQSQALCGAASRPVTTEECNMESCTTEELDEVTTPSAVSCDESEFGCCPDGNTTALGPYKEGCDSVVTRGCEASLYKCCSDGVTAATGPNFAGCDEEQQELVADPPASIACLETEFGCCPNEEDAATGPNQEGCEKESQQEEVDVCMLPMDLGNCRAYTVKYYYNPDFGQCTQFWYGGCGGNENLFDTYADCRDECIGLEEQLTQEELCSLPADVGPCKKSLEKFFYNPKSGRCESFKYGGCRGNKNRFRSESDCEIVCGTYNEDPCTLQPEFGNCRNTLQRWYYNTYTQMCEEFAYSGCLGNQNRFMDKQSCEQQCNANVIDSVERVSKYDKCSISFDVGSCKAAFPMWFYDVVSGKCAEFVYGGCDGNHNRFETELECQQSCYVEGKTLCERLRALYEDSGIQDQPQCKLDGSFEPLQCPPNSDLCWCVTDLGDEIEGSRIQRGVHTLRPDCSVYENSAGNVQPVVTVPPTTVSMEDLTVCQQHQITAQGSYVPQCTDSGEYEPMQCYGTNDAYCWCVDEIGEEIRFTRTLPGQPRPRCQGILESVCFVAYQATMDGTRESSYMPECTPQGLFVALQCQTEAGCVCVNQTTGDVLFSLDLDPGTVTPRACEGMEAPVLTVCQRHRQEAMRGRENAPEDWFVPECSEDGSYTSVQCYDGQARYCWCVNEGGDEIENTRQRDGIPDCSASGTVEETPTQLSTPATTQSPVAAVTPTEAVLTANESTSTFIMSTMASVVESSNDVLDDEQDVTGEDCAQTPFGCCPDGVTPADGDDLSNCPGVSSASISASESAINARAGNTVVLSCEATGEPLPEISWRRYGEDVGSLEDSNRFQVTSSGTLTIHAAKVSDSGPYECIASNGIGTPDTATFEITITTRSRPRQNRRYGTGQTRVKTRAGEQVTMHCRARGNPTPIITWEFQGLELTSAEPRIHQLESGSLRISHVGLGDIGTYKCTARNMYGIVQMKAFTLIVEADVNIVDPPQSTRASVGDTIHLRCGTTGSPKPSVMWSLNGNPLHSTQRFIVNENNDLTIKDIKQTDAGRYSCTAANGISSMSATASVTVSGVVVDPNCQDQPRYAACQLIVIAKLCSNPWYAFYCCRTCRDNGMLPTTLAP